MDKQFTASEVHERERFEEWYTTHACNYSRDPIGGRDCSLQWEAWKAALAAHSAQAQPNIPDLTDEEWEILFHFHPELKARLQKVFDAHDAQAQPPAARVPDALAVFEVVSGVEGPCLTISRNADGKPRHEYRLAGPKPWGGGNTTHSFRVLTRELREQIDAIEAALAAQENPHA